jgi:hypothetical protein
MLFSGRSKTSPTAGQENSFEDVNQTIPILTNPKDIQDSIEQQALNRTFATEQTGGGIALPSSNVTPQSNVPVESSISPFQEEPQPVPFNVINQTQEKRTPVDFLSPEEANSRKEIFAKETNKKFMQSENPLGMSNTFGNLDAGVIQRNVREEISKIGNKRNRLTDIKFDRNEGSALMEFAEEQVNRSNVEDSAWAIDEGATSVYTDPEQKEAVSRTLAVSGMKLLDDIYTKRYLNQVLISDDTIDKREYETEYDKDEARLNKEIDKPLSKQETVSLFEQGDNILQAMATSLSNDMLVQAPFVPDPSLVINTSDVDSYSQQGDSVQVAVDKATRDYNAKYKAQEAEYNADIRRNAIVYIKDLTDQGYIRWARNKKGKAIPVEGESVLTDGFLSAANTLNKLYTISARDSVAAGFPAQATPALVNGGLFSKNTNKVLLDKKGKPKVKESTNLAISLMESVGIQVNPILSKAMSMMFKEKVSPIFSNTISELGDDKYNKYLSKHGAEVANKIMSRAVEKVTKEISDVQKREAAKIPFYLTVKLSGPTNRMFPITNNLNPTTQKGTTRATMSFAGTRPVFVSERLFSSEPTYIIKIVDRIFGKRNKGVARGTYVNNELHRLKRKEPETLQAMNYYYNLGYQYANHIDSNDAIKFSELNLNNRKVYAWSTRDFIDYGITKQEAAAAKGKEFLEAMNPTPDGQTNSLSQFAENNPWLTDKGEWQYPSSVIVDAFNISQTQPGQPIRLQNIMEQDARQSNAGMISILIGDTDTADYLGLNMSEEESDYAGLRERIFSGASDDINSAFGPNAREYGAAWAKLFDTLSKVAGESKAAKIYSRGLVVAGLYGKTPQKMYSEAVDMLTQLRSVANSTNNSEQQIEYSNAFREISELYNNDLNSMDTLNDITDILVMASENHMSKLNGYQIAMKSLGGAMAAINAPSVINNMLGDTQTIAGSNYSAVLRDNIEDTVFGTDVFATEKIAGMNIMQFESMEDRAPAAKTRLDDGETLVKQRAGSAIRNAWPVDIIQGIDSVVMKLAFLAMNSPENGFDGVAVQAIGVHDALITGPEGHLIASNAYNNIAIPSFAINSPSLIQGVLDTYNDRLNELRNNQFKYGANIGTQFIGGDSVNSSFHGLTGYFDTLYDQVYGANSESKVSNPDLSLENNKTSTFITQRQLERRPDKQEGTIKRNLKSKAVLEAAFRSGYLPPTSDNENKRKFYKVNGKQFKDLVNIMRAASGLILDASETPLVLKNAYGKIEKGFRPSSGAARRHFVSYNSSSKGDNGAETSGMFVKMTAKRNMVINNMLNGDGEILHLR